MTPQGFRNEKGFITLDFVFASLLIFGLSSVIFSFGMTLSIVEVVQYMSFASARQYNLAHLDEPNQRQRAEAHYQNLISNPIFRPLVENGWFEVGQVQLGDHNDLFEPEAGYDNFWGARIPFSAPILYKRIPFVGTTGQDRNAFQTTVQSFLAREPTFVECRDFMDQRRQAFANIFGQTNADEAHIMMDNGC
jgi:hypothetical protein